MRSTVQIALLIGLAVASAPAQRQPRPATHTTSHEQAGVRPTQTVDGLAILSAALDSRHRILTRRDCSHFVHDLYQQAGFPYEYASSDDLYDGVDEFRLVTNPQPGDLAAWRGHVGIVVDPAQHSFFSLLTSGPGVDLYDAPYWRKRGRPRFYRYVKAAPSNSPSPVRNANWKPSARNAEDLEGAASFSEGTTADVASPAIPGSELPATPATSAKLPPPLDPPAPRPVLISGAKPSREQVSGAFLESCRDVPRDFQGRDLLHSSQTVIVFDRLEVKKVHFSKSTAWAEIEISEPVSPAAEKAQLRKRTEHQRWTLSRRAAGTWELTPAPNTLYLSQATAARLLASELARLTEGSNETTPEKTQLARLLDALLEK